MREDLAMRAVRRADSAVERLYCHLFGCPRVPGELSTLPARALPTDRAENDPQSPEHNTATMMTLAHAVVVAPVASRVAVR